MNKLRWITMASLVLVVAVPAMAQSRTWTKIHSTVELPGDPVIATYTKIFTSDGQSPQLARFLVEDKLQRRLVYREEVNKDASAIHGTSSMTMRLELLLSGEALEIAVAANGSGSLVVGGSTISFTDDDSALDLPSSVTTAALAAFGTTSSDFKSAVTEFVKLGRLYSETFDSASYCIARVLFPSLQHVSVSDDLTLAGAHVINFDPQLIPPEPFEVPFGAAYYN